MMAWLSISQHPPGKLTASTKDFLSFLGLSSLSSAPGGPQKTCPNHRQRCGSTGKPGSVVAVSCLDCFKGKGSLYRYVYRVTEKAFRYQLRGGMCATAPSDLGSTVLQRANYLFENGFGNYDSVKNNCEDFAFYCKTGILTLDDKGPRMSGRIAYLARMFPKMAEKYFSISISKEAVEERFRNNGTEFIKVPVEDMNKFHRSAGLILFQDEIDL
ncbi:hypothetical protein Vadar_005243 [Vaccinium darrowii]|uniref:Uncharacterized protein n=1 Tax=Vaccinium darrowii TaxID=229202 RepID=A0ACB7ZAM0_9ERIC|nr:hypothetical protein Vadar_005243 [Vaccinium darrowii]